MLTLDYPMLQNIQDLSGVDAIYEYIRAVRIEAVVNVNHLERVFVL